MKTNITFSAFCDAFRDMGRNDQFSYAAKRALFDFLEEVAPDMELDVIALCCDYCESDIDSIIMTVTRDGEFTEEFAQEISDYAAEAAGISYHEAVQLVGAPYINDTLLFVAGSDGSYIS